MEVSKRKVACVYFLPQYAMYPGSPRVPTALMKPYFARVFFSFCFCGCFFAIAETSRGGASAMERTGEIVSRT